MKVTAREYEVQSSVEVEIRSERQRIATLGKVTVREESEENEIKGFGCLRSSWMSMEVFYSSVTLFEEVKRRISS